MGVPLRSAIEPGSGSQTSPDGTWRGRIVSLVPGWAPTLLFVVAFGLRLVGIHWGGTHPDENFGASAKVLTGQLVPDFHYYPPLLDYVNACAYVGLFVLGYVGGFWSDTAAFRQQYFDDITPFIVAGRLPTIAMGAACAPMAWLLARQLGAKPRLAAVVGLAVGILPVNVWLSHFSKSDIAMSFGFLLMASAYLRASTHGSSTRAAMWFAAACGFTVSFKHSAVFFVAPLTVCFLLRRAWLSRTLSSVLKLAATWGVTFALVWAPLNIGILLDLQRFLEFQKLQSLISGREAGLDALWTSTLPRLASDGYGASLAVLLLWVVSPALLPSFRYVSLWGVLGLAILSVAVIVGPRVTDGLFVAHVTLMAAMACAALSTATVRGRWSSHLPLIALLLVTGDYAAGAFDVQRQAVRDSQLGEKLTRVVLSIATPGETRVLSAGPELSYPIDPRVQDVEWQRHQRLAQKYGVELPPMSEENARHRTTSIPSKRTPLYVRPMPFVFGGLEIYDEADVPDVQPYAWPPQPEEYSLDYWIDEGFSVFVVSNEEGYLTSDSRFYRQRHYEIRERCELVTTIAPERPLFFESEIKVYRLPAELEDRARAARNAAP